MIWKYFIPAVWEHDQAVWEDIFLLPSDPEYDGQALWLTIDALGYYEGEERAEAEAKLGHHLYVVDGSDMLVRAESFSKRELLDWVSLWFDECDVEFSGLKEASLKEFRGRMEQYDSLQASEIEAESDEVEQVHVHPDTLTLLATDAETGYQNRVFLPRSLFAELEALPAAEVAELKQMLKRLANGTSSPAEKKMFRTSTQ